MSPRKCANVLRTTPTTSPSEYANHIPESRLQDLDMTGLPLPSSPGVDQSSASVGAGGLSPLSPSGLSEERDPRWLSCPIHAQPESQNLLKSVSLGNLREVYPQNKHAASSQSRRKPLFTMDDLRSSAYGPTFPVLRSAKSQTDLMVMPPPCTPGTQPTKQGRRSLDKRIARRAPASLPLAARPRSTTPLSLAASRHSVTTLASPSGHRVSVSGKQTYSMDTLPPVCLATPYHTRGLSVPPPASQLPPVPPPDAPRCTNRLCGPQPQASQSHTYTKAAKKGLSSLNRAQPSMLPRMGLQSDLASWAISASPTSMNDIFLPPSNNDGRAIRIPSITPTHSLPPSCGVTCKWVDAHDRSNSQGIHPPTAIVGRSGACSYQPSACSSTAFHRERLRKQQSLPALPTEVPTRVSHLTRPGRASSPARASIKGMDLSPTACVSGAHSALQDDGIAQLPIGRGGRLSATTPPPCTPPPTVRSRSLLRLRHRGAALPFERTPLGKISPSPSPRPVSSSSSQYVGQVPHGTADIEALAASLSLAPHAAIVSPSTAARASNTPTRPSEVESEAIDKSVFPAAHEHTTLERPTPVRSGSDSQRPPSGDVPRIPESTSSPSPAPNTPNTNTTGEGGLSPNSSPADASVGFFRTIASARPSPRRKRYPITARFL